MVIELLQPSRWIPAGAMVGAAALALALAAALPGQYQYSWGFSRGYQSTPPGWSPNTGLAPNPGINRPAVNNSPLAPYSVTGPSLPRMQPGFQSMLQAYSTIPGFPTYPKGYGVGPRVGGFLPAERPDLQLVGGWRPEPAMPRRPTGWPSWIEEKVAGDVRVATPERAILARAADRVWFLAPDDTAFAPLAFYDKFRLVESGSVIEVRNKGEFQLVFDDGSLLRSSGPVRLAVPRLAQDVAELQIRSLQHVWLTAKARPYRLTLPDGSSLEVQSSAVYLERSGRRCIVYAHGPLPVQWSSRTGPVEIKPAQCVELLAEPADKPFLAAGLQLEGEVDATAKGRTVEITGSGAGGHVVWSGARIRVPAGSTVVIDGLTGSKFPEDVQ